jgi:hypothetical protein
MDVKHCVLLSLVLALASLAVAQPTLTCTKNGNDVVLNWSGGTSPFDAIKDTVPYFSSNPNMLLAGSSGTTYTDGGALTNGIAVEFYTVADATKPTITITNTIPASPTAARSIQVNGTYSNSTYVSVNAIPAAFGSGSYSASPVLLFLGGNTVTASAMDAIGNVAFAQLAITRLQGNVPPEITFTPAEGTTLYDDTPDLTVLFCDADGFADLDNGSVVIQLDGMSPSFTPNFVSDCPGGSLGWSWTYTPTTPLSNGYHSLTAMIKDTKGYYTNGSSSFILSNPVITLLTPAEGAIGATITIDGAGFSTTAGNNTVKFGSVQATVTMASVTQLTVTVPSGAVGGPVTVTVNGRTSNAKPFTLLLASGFTDISSVAINDVMADATKTPIVFTVMGAADRLYQINKDGTLTDLGGCSNDPVGLPKDASNNLYCGSSAGGLGPVNKYTPGSGISMYIADTHFGSEPSGSVGGMGIDSSGNLYTLDNINGSLKRVNTNLTLERLNNQGLSYTPSNSAIQSQDGTKLYFTEISRVRSIPLPAGGTSTIISAALSGPTGMANTLTSEGWLVMARRGLTAKAVSVYDPVNNVLFDFAKLLTNRPYDADFGTDADGPYVVVAERERVYRIPKPSLTLQAFNGTSSYPIPTKVYADYDPVLNIDSPGQQYLLLEVRTNPDTLIPNTMPASPPYPYAPKVTWTVEDPDDPSDDTQIDANDDPTPNSPNDNVLTLGNYPMSYQWDDWDVYTMDEGINSNSATVHTKIVSGVSRVMLNFSGYPGDNFKVTVQVAIPVYGTIEAVSQVITIWKKLYVELDSMGQCDGPMDADDDDAICTDIPEPLMDLFAAAFKPAYIEILPATQTTPAMVFRYHLSTTDDYLHQDYIANKDLPNSAAGHWEAYLYGAYEPASNIDNDPDSEPNSQGGVVECYYDPGTFLIDGNLIVATLHVEVIRDFSKEVSIDENWRSVYAALHECGHWLRLDDLSGGVMDYGVSVPPHFTNCQIKWIRKCNEYPGKWFMKKNPPVDHCTEMCPNP